MNKQLLIISIAAILATPSAFAAYDPNVDLNTGTDDDAVDKQAVTVTVPQVALLDVIDATAMTIVVDDTSTDTATKIVTPKNAGGAFTGQQSLTGSTYKLSSNVEALTAKTRKLTGKLDAALPAGWKLSAKVAKPDGTAGTSIDFNGTTDVELVTAIGNTRTTTAQSIEYILAPDSTGIMAHATAQAVTVTYTLSADS